MGIFDNYLDTIKNFKKNTRLPLPPPPDNPVPDWRRELNNEILTGPNPGRVPGGNAGRADQRWMDDIMANIIQPPMEPKMSQNLQASMRDSGLGRFIQAHPGEPPIDTGEAYGGYKSSRVPGGGPPTAPFIGPMPGEFKFIMPNRNTPGLSSNGGRKPGRNSGGPNNPHDLGGPPAPVEEIAPPSTMDLINDILNRNANLQGTPGHWVNSHTQSQLNMIANGLQGVGQAGQAEFQASKGDINANYDRSLNTRAGENAQLMEQLTSNLSNLGIGMQGSPTEQGFVNNAQHLNETAGLNRASDLSFSDKLGDLSSYLGNQLSNAAREGLLTDRQYIPATEARMSEVDKFRLGLLQDQLGSESDLENQLKLSQAATETSEHTNPLVAESIANLADPKLRDEAARLYDLHGSPEGALAEIAGREQLGPWDTQIAPDDMSMEGANTLLRNALAEDRQKKQDAALAEWFRALSPTWNGNITKRTTTNSSKQNLS